MEDLRLVKRNTEEIVKEDEIRDLMEEGNPSAYLGYEPSGPLHIGHWAGIEKMVDLQQAGFDTKILFADLHAWKNKKGPENFNSEERLEWLGDMGEKYMHAVFKALGLDADYRRGTNFQTTGEYESDLEKMKNNISATRADHALGDVGNRAEKDLDQLAEDLLDDIRGAESLEELEDELEESEEIIEEYRKSEGATVAQLEYPIMQSLDIPYMDADVAVGGIDQRPIHMLAREVLPDLEYGKPIAVHYPLLPALSSKKPKEAKKMSSSDAGTMFALHADPEEIERKIHDTYFDPADDMDNNPLMQVTKKFIFGADQDLNIERPEKYGGDATYQDYESLALDVEEGDLHPEDLKNGLAEEIIDRLKPVREQFEENPELLEPLMVAGYEEPDYISN